MIPDTLSKEQRLRTLLSSYKSVLVAFSGGCDSALVAKLARDLLGKSSVLAVSSRSESLPQKETQTILSFVKRHDIAHLWVKTREIEDANYARNPVNRCFFCKTELYTVLTKLAKEKGFDFIANGTNADDLGDWRPGLKAAKDHRVVRPLVEAGFSKAEVRMLSEKLGLETWDKPASACLSSRIPYGSWFTPQKLTQIDQGEALLQDYGFRILRLRHFGSVARLEFGIQEKQRLEQDPLLQDEIFEKIKALGFDEVKIDPRGYRQGSLNPTEVGVG